MTNPYPVTEDHLVPFGSIVMIFARFERLVETVASHTMGAEITLASIALSGLGYGGKCEAALALLSAVDHQGDDIGTAEKIKEYINKFNKYSSLRNHIAHRIWKAGTRPNSIKPLGLAIRGKLKGYGLSDGDQDYTIEELFDIANALTLICQDFRDFLASKGITPAIATKIEDTNSG